MENLNAEQVKTALECCKGDAIPCADCIYADFGQCQTYMATDALALIESQEQRIKELTEENKQFRYEQGKLIEERDTFREYAYNMQRYVESIKHKEEKGYEPSAARYSAEMEMWRVVALEKKKLTDENERLRASYNAYYTELALLREANEKLERICHSYALQYGTATDKEVLLKKERADTVRKMHSEIKERCIKGGIYPAFVARTIEQIANEMLEEMHDE